MLLQGIITKYLLRKSNVGWNIEIMASSEINEMSVGVYVVLVVQMIQTPATIIA
jgi:hypothetical protein